MPPIIDFIERIFIFILIMTGIINLKVLLLTKRWMQVLVLFVTPSSSIQPSVQIHPSLHTK